MPYKNLDKYDQFFRVIGLPFIEMKLEDFLEEIEFLVRIHDKEVNPYRKETPKNSEKSGLNLMDGLADGIADLADKANVFDDKKSEEWPDEMKKNYNAYKFNMDHMPYVKFLEYYKVKPSWERHIQNVDSPFMKLLQLDNLFFIKKILKAENDNRPSKTIIDYAAPQGMIDLSLDNASRGGDLSIGNLRLN